MVLDINVKWDTMTEAEEQAQYNGRERQAPEVGYLFYNAASRICLRTLAAKHDLPRLLHDVFEGWPAWYEGCYAYGPRCKSGLEHYQNVLVETQRTLEAKLPRTDDLVYYQEELHNWITFIDFILAHADKPGLRIEFT